MIESGSVKDRILLTSMKLFYVQGIKSTGINQIIEESRAAKASFYKHFPSKRDLIKACVIEYDKIIKNQMVSVVMESVSFQDFVRKWVVVIKGDLQIIYRGCPIAESCFQLDSDDSDLMKLMQDIIYGWENLVSQFLNKMVKNDLLPATMDIEKVSKRMVHLYEGAATMRRITNDDSYIDDLEYLMARMLE